MTSIGITAILGTLFLLYSSVLWWEEKRNNRLFFGGLRSRLDYGIVLLSKRISSTFQILLKRTVTLSWYYSLHALLRLLLRFIAGLYFAVEQMFINNRNKARQIRRTQNNSHLAALSEHQKETALTEKEKKKRKDKALKG